MLRSLEPTEDAVSHILYRENLNRTLPVAVAGDGPYLIDAAGKRYIDASAGAAVSCLGHSNEAVRAAIREQSDRLAFAHSRFFTTEAAEKLADDLVAGAPGELSKVWLTCGGSESGRSSAEAHAPVFCRERPGAKKIRDCAPSGLSRQHVWRAVLRAATSGAAASSSRY
jgi:acetylornithine/succinyldiaminopimelate/putrescine aminotransferase